MTTVCAVCGRPRSPNRNDGGWGVCRDCYPAEQERRRVARYLEWFWSKVDGSGDCWEWTGTRNRYGYGEVRNPHLSTTVAHRFAWERLIGAIDSGMTLDHLCRNPRCVNPDHLEPVTNAENIQRGFSPTALNRRKTHCQHGHPFDQANTYVGATGYRVCRACNARRTREYEARRAGVAA